MICPNCGRNIPDTSERCAHCGQPTEFSSVRNQRPQPPVIRQAPGNPIENFSPSNEALERLAARVKALPTASDLRRNLRRHMLISVAAVLLAAVIGFVLGFSFGSAHEPVTAAVHSPKAAVQTAQPTVASAPSQYTITFIQNAPPGTVKGMPPSRTKIEDMDTTINMVKPTRQGYQFNGWNTDKNGGGETFLAGSTFKIDADTTLYAQWSPLQSPTMPPS